MANGEFGESEIDGPTRTIVTGRRPATPGKPAVWSACEWVMTSNGISVTPTEVGDHALADDDERARPALHALVEEYVVACYGPNPPAADAAERVWSAYDVLDGELRSRLAPRQRWFHQLDPRPLLTRR